MKGLIFSHNPPIPITSLPKPRCPNLRQRTWRLPAGAKGFGSAPAEEKKSRTELVRQKASESKKGKDDEDDKIPDEVFEKMIVRILFSVGAPMSTGLALLKGIDVVKEQNLWAVPVWLPFVAIFFTFGASALGIAYGTLSTSLDPEKKGSLLGFEQVEKNWAEMWEEEEEEDTSS